MFRRKPVETTQPLLIGLKRGRVSRSKARAAGREPRRMALALERSHLHDEGAIPPPYPYFLRCGASGARIACGRPAVSWCRGLGLSDGWNAWKLAWSRT